MRLPVLLCGLSLTLAVTGLSFAQADEELTPHQSTPHAQLARYEGFTEPSRELIVESYLDGVLETLHVKAGDSFKAGSALVKLDDGMQVLAVEVARLQSESQGEVKIAEARVAEAEVELESQEYLAERSSATDRDVRRARAALDVARAELELAKENLVLAAKQAEIERERLKLYTIRAPFDGQVLAVATQDGAEEGAALQQNDRIMHIAQLDPIVAKISLPEAIVQRLKVDTAYPLAFGASNDARPARLTRIAAQADRGSQLVEVVFEVANPEGELRSGQRCRLLDTAATGQLTAR